MNHISIECMDGVGKSTTCKLLAERLGYIFVEKPLHYLLDDSDDEIKQYQKVAKRVNDNPNRNFTAWYYGLNNIYLYEKDDRKLIHCRQFSNRGMSHDFIKELAIELKSNEHCVV